MVKLRNPWGYNITNGGHINGSPELAEVLGCNDKKNGIIYVTLKELFDLVTQISVGFYR